MKEFLDSPVALHTEAAGYLKTLWKLAFILIQSRKVEALEAAFTKLSLTI